MSLDGPAQTSGVRSAVGSTALLGSTALDALGLGWVPALIGVAFAAAGELSGGPTLLLLLTFNVALNLPHQWGTWARVWDRADAALSRRLLRSFALVLAALSAIALAPVALRTLVFVELLTYYGVHHLVMQHFGITRLLRARAGQPLGSRTADLLFFSALFGLGLLRLHLGPALLVDFAGARLPMWQLPLWEPLRAPLGTLTHVAYWLLVGARLFTVPRFGARFHYELATSLALYPILFLTTDLGVTVVAATALHNAQYLVVVRALAPVRSALGTLRFAGAAAGYAALVTAGFVLSRQAGHVLFTSLVVTHYLADALLWRRSAPTTSSAAPPAVPASPG